MNRQIYPMALYPIDGDVVSQTANTKVRVVGINGIAIDTSVFLEGGEVLTYDPNVNKWVPQSNSRIQVNSLTVSDDYYVSVNVAKQIKVNGV